MKKLILVCCLFLFSFSSMTFADDNVDSAEEGYISHLKIGTEVLITHRAPNSAPNQYQIGIISEFYSDGTMVVTLIRDSIESKPNGRTTILSADEFKYLDIRCLKGSALGECGTPQALSFINDGFAVYTNGEAYQIGEKGNL